jgi:multidrug efflux system membrane fusion protein
MNRSVVIAGAIALGAVAWIVSGQFGAHDRTQAAVPAPPASRAEPVLVRTRMLEARPYEREIVLRGRSSAARWVDLKAETQGRVADLPMAKGGIVKAGEVVARLAADEREARRAETDALLRQRRIEHDASVALAEKGFRPIIKVAESQAALDAARAAAKAVDVELQRTLIRAPFGGVIEERKVEVGAYVKSGDIVARLIERDPMLIVAQVGERDVATLGAGRIGNATLATGETVQGRIRFVASVADPATRTFTVELEVPNPDGRLKDGITAELRFAADSHPAHLVTPAILAMDDNGAVGLNLVDDGGRVTFRPVRILGDGPQGVWLDGLPAKVTAIVVGQDFVRAGDKVRAVAAEGPLP